MTTAIPSNIGVVPLAHDLAHDLVLPTMVVPIQTQLIRAEEVYWTKSRVISLRHTRNQLACLCYYINGIIHNNIITIIVVAFCRFRSVDENRS